MANFWIGVLEYFSSPRIIIKLNGSLVVAVALVFVCGFAQANEKCVGLQTMAGIDLVGNLMALVGSAEAPCGSLASVVDKIVNRKKTGGRKLESDKPLNIAEAQANQEAALRDPAIRARIEKVKRDVRDENVRLIYEAAIYDDEGYYSARELLVQQLLQRLN